MTKSERIDEAIRRNEVLSRVRTSSREKLVGGAMGQEFEKGGVICQQGSPAVRFWLVTRGEVKLVKYSSKGIAVSIDIVLPNQVFGAIFYDHDPVYPWSAVATKPAELLSFRLRDLVDDLESNPPLQKRLLADTCYKLCQAQQMRVLWLEEARVRIAHLLLYLYEKFGRVIPQTRATLAELAGTSVETAIRISTALARRGILVTRREQIEIVSLARLRACAEGGGADV